MSQLSLRPDWDPGLSFPGLPIQHFLEIGIEALLIDVDGTLLSGKEIKLEEPVKSWVMEAKNHFFIHLLSNNPSKKRIHGVADQLGITFTCAAAKPRKKSLNNIISKLNIKPQKIAIVGDRIFTDILAGNRLGLYTVLVKPLPLNGENISKNYFQKVELSIARSLEKILQ